MNRRIRWHDFISMCMSNLSAHVSRILVFISANTWKQQRTLQGCNIRRGTDGAQRWTAWKENNSNTEMEIKTESGIKINEILECCSDDFAFITFNQAFRSTAWALWKLLRLWMCSKAVRINLALSFLNPVQEVARGCEHYRHKGVRELWKFKRR